MSNTNPDTRVSGWVFWPIILVLGLIGAVSSYHVILILSGLDPKSTEPSQWEQTIEFTQDKCNLFLLQSGFKIGQESCTCFQSSNKYECFHPLSNGSLLVIRCESANWDSCTVGDRL